ncbi:hypothetical protein ScPMuIL_014297 [Solemya velum]
MQREFEEDDKFGETSDASTKGTSPVSPRSQLSNNVPQQLKEGPLDKKPGPAPKFSVSGNRTVIPVRLVDSESAIDPNTDGDGQKCDFRDQLRKTNIDLSSTIKRKETSEHAQLVHPSDRFLISDKEN